jgi:hypothetical protein
MELVRQTENIRSLERYVKSLRELSEQAEADVKSAYSTIASVNQSTLVGMRIDFNTNVSTIRGQQAKYFVSTIQDGLQPQNTTT